MSEKVGAIHYDVTLETGSMVDGQRKVRNELNATTSALDGFSSKLSAVAVGVAVLAAAMVALKAAKMADDMRMLGAKVEVAAGSMESGASAMAALVAMSRITQTSVAANAEVFTRLNQSMLQMGGTQADTLRITELLGKAIRVSGASAIEAKSAMLQFGQAMGSGRLQGDEFRSMMENAPYLMQKLAAGIGVPIGELKKLSTEGKLTADVVASALNKASAQIDADFKKFPQTIAAAMAVSADATARANEKLDELTGTSIAVTGAVKGLGEVMDKLGEQLGAANTEAGTLGRNDKIKGWADTTKVALSYLVDAVDVVWQTVSVLGRNVAYMFTGIGTEIGGIGAQVMAVMRGDFAGAAAIGDAMKADSDQRRKELDARDKESLKGQKLAGQQMREAWEQGAGGGRGSINPQSAPSKLKPTRDDAADKKAANEAKKLATRALAAQEYYDGLVAGNKTALEKIDAEEKKALTENQKRQVADGGNVEIYAKARLEISAKYARERSKLEEKTMQEVADLNIQLTTDESAKIELIRSEAIRKADAAEKLGVMTHGEAERVKTLATFTNEQARLDLAERNERARSDARITLSGSQEQKILLIRDESVRQAEESFKRGKITFEEQEAAKVKAAFDASQQLKALQASHASIQINTLQIQASSGGSAKQEELIRAQAAAAITAAENARLQDLSASQLYADQKVAIEAKMQQDIIDLRANANMAALTSTSDIFGSLASIMKGAASEQSGIYRAMFAAQKAFAIASAIVNIQKGISDAAAEGATWQQKLVAMSVIASSTAGIVSTIQGTNYGGGRQYGGTVSSGSMYRVNETGAPEMFTSNNGNQYMMPTKSGKVTAADKVGGGGIVVSVSVDASGSSAQGNSTQATQLGNMIGNAVRGVLVQEKRPGGMLA